jgi:hypothetical protein
MSDIAETVAALEARVAALESAGMATPDDD